MAESPDTTSPSRRLFLAAGPAAAVFASLKVSASEAPSPLAPEERRVLLENYQTWLKMELAYLDHELDSMGAFRCNNAGWRYHWRAYQEEPAPQPSTRAETVLAAVGCNWRADLRGVKGGANV